MKLNRKGQVTIPRALRDQFGLHPDPEVIFEARDGVLIKPASAVRRALLKDCLRRAHGSSTTGLSTSGIMRLTRDAH
jgi:antitoxin PrlF